MQVCVCVRGQEVMVNFQSLPLHTERQTWIMRFVDTCCESTESISWGLGYNKSGRPGISSFTLGGGGWRGKKTLVPCCPSDAPTLCDPMDCSTPGFPILHDLPEFAQIHVHWVGDAIKPSHPLPPPSPPALNLSQHQGLIQWVSSSHQWPKYWSFSFIISPSNEYSGLISFIIDWFDLLAVQVTLKRFL